MDELEQRLRSALTGLANEVPPSTNAWADHERRVAQRSKRARLRPALMAVAAAAAVALIAVPVLLLNTRDDDNELGVATSLSEPPTSESRPSTSVAQLPGRPTYKPASGETLIVPPAGVTGEQVGKEFRNIYAFAVSKDNQDMLCIGEGPIRSAGTFDQDDIVKLRTCVPIPPTRAGRVIALKYNVPSTSNQGAYVFVSTNNTANILVKRTEGNIVPAGRIGSGPTFSLFSTVLGSSKPAIAFTAKDANNVSLENS